MHQRNILIIVDTQIDFITGSLGSKEAQKIIKKICERIKYFKSKGFYIILTRDTHSSEGKYLETCEGRNLPVEHCISGSEGWNIHPDIWNLVKDYDKKIVIDKVVFGYAGWEEIDLCEKVGVVKTSEFVHKGDGIYAEVCGLCTDICVISNVMCLRAAYPGMEIYVLPDCCAGVTPEKHEQALSIMESCQVHVVRDNISPYKYQSNIQFNEISEVGNPIKPGEYLVLHWYGGISQFSWCNGWNCFEQEDGVVNKQNEIFDSVIAWAEIPNHNIDLEKYKREVDDPEDGDSD